MEQNNGIETINSFLSEFKNLNLEQIKNSISKDFIAYQMKKNGDVEKLEYAQYLESLRSIKDSQSSELDLKVLGIIPLNTSQFLSMIEVNVTNGNNSIKLDYASVFKIEDNKINEVRTLRASDKETEGFWDTSS